MNELQVVTPEANDMRQGFHVSRTEHDIMRSVEDHYWWYQALRQHVASSIAPVAPTFSLLDAGCGTGGMLKMVREKFPLADLTGVDQSEHAVELTAGRETGAKLVPASVHELPFPQDSFDFVLSLDVLSHAGVDDALALHEMHRVLRPGGRLILNLAAFDFLKGAHDSAVDVDRRYTQRQVRTLLEGADFAVERLILLERDLRAAHRPLAVAQPRPSAARMSAALGFPPAPALREFDFSARRGS